MARQSEGEPGAFAQSIAREFRRETGDLRMSGRTLASVLGKSEKYVRERLNGTFAFTLNDIESFAAHLGIDPEEFVSRSERESAQPTRLRPLNVGTRPDTDLETVPLDITKLAASRDNTPIDPSHGEG